MSVDYGAVIVDPYIPNTKVWGRQIEEANLLAPGGYAVKEGLWLGISSSTTKSIVVGSGQIEMFSIRASVSGLFTIIVVDTPTKHGYVKRNAIVMDTNVKEPSRVQINYDDGGKDIKVVFEVPFKILRPIFSVEGAMTIVFDTGTFTQTIDTVQDLKAYQHDTQVMILNRLSHFKDVDNNELELSTLTARCKNIAFQAVALAAASAPINKMDVIADADEWQQRGPSDRDDKFPTKPERSIKTATVETSDTIKFKGEASTVIALGSNSEKVHVPGAYVVVSGNSFGGMRVLLNRQSGEFDTVFRSLNHVTSQWDNMSTKEQRAWVAVFARELEAAENLVNLGKVALAAVTGYKPEQAEKDEKSEEN